MRERRTGERGQALVMFAIMATALLGAVALVVDVGQLYMQQRRIQNVADMAALVGAQRRVNDLSYTLDTSSAVKDARVYAERNGVATDAYGAEGIWSPGPNNGVMVLHPPQSGNHVGDRGYLEVRTARTVPSIFAGVLSGGSVRLEGRAVARGWGGFAEAAVVALREDPLAIKAGGNSAVYVDGSIYSRGGIDAESAAGYLNIDGWAYARMPIIGADFDADGTWTGPDVPNITDPNWSTPPASSTGPGVIWNSSAQPVHEYDATGTAWKFIEPGTYKEITVANGDHVMFKTGVYRVTGGLSGRNFKIMGVAAGYSHPSLLTTPNDPPHGDPVCFVLDDGVTFEITATGTAHFRSAATIGGINVGNLIVRSYEDRNSVKIVGQGSISLLGTVYTPSGDTELAGSTGGTVHGQVVSGTVSLLGGTGPAVIYDPTRVPPTRRSWLVE